MKNLALPRRQAFTVLDGLVFVAVMLVLIIVLLPALAQRFRCSGRAGCANNLKQIGADFWIWQGDNHEKYPMNFPVAQGGAQELMAAGNVATCFQVMSNELASPIILVCPADKQRKYATNFNTILTRTNISYFLALNASESDPQAILSGDDNLIQNRQPVSPGIINLTTSPVTWTKDRHQGAGFILVADGSVQSVRQMGFASSAGTCFATNRIVVP